MTDKITVAHIAPIFSTVPPIGYGGVERVVDELSYTQLLSGAVSPIVFASSDSSCAAPHFGLLSSLRSQPDKNLDEEYKLIESHYRWAYGYLDAHSVDIIHLHGPWGVRWLPSQPSRPVVLSIYADTSQPDVQEELSRVPIYVNIVANSERTRAKAPQIDWSAVILEGIMPHLYPFSARKEDYVCFIGDLTPDKGIETAILAARSAGIAIHVVGRRHIKDVSERDMAKYDSYFASSVAPYIDNKTVIYHGELGDERLEILSRATALLAPIEWEEPFGRILAESMACGTPVIAFDKGAAQEVIAEGVSGFVVTDVTQMVGLIPQCRNLDPVNCRHYVENKLNMARVANEYGELYRRLVRDNPHSDYAQDRGDRR